MSKYTQADIEKWRKAYEAKEKPSFTSTRFLRKRLLIVGGCFLVIMLATAALPETETEFSLFQIPFIIAFLLLVAFIDQIIFGWYLYTRDRNEGDELFE